MRGPADKHLGRPVGLPLDALQDFASGYWHFARGFDSQPHYSAARGKHGDRDIAVDDEGFALLARKNEHGSWSSLTGSSLRKTAAAGLPCVRLPHDAGNSTAILYTCQPSPKAIFFARLCDPDAFPRISPDSAMTAREFPTKPLETPGTLDNRADSTRAARELVTTGGSQRQSEARLLEFNRARRTRGGGARGSARERGRLAPLISSSSRGL